MKFEIVKDLLFKRLADLNSIVDRKTTLTILSHIYLKLENQQLTLICTDTEITLKTQIPVINQLSAGAITIPCDKFYQFIQRIDDGTLITCELVNEQFHIHAGKTIVKLATLPAKDFPIPLDNHYLHHISLDASLFHNLLNKVKYAIANQDGRQYLNGLLLNIIDDGYTLDAVSTDGHRLACAQLSFEEAIASNIGFIVPEKAVNELVKHLSLDAANNELLLQKKISQSVDETTRLNEQIDILKELRKQPAREHSQTYARPITLHFSERKLSLEIGSYQFSTRLIDGQYPAYRQVIPLQQENPILIERLALLAALRRAKVLLTDRHDGVRLHFVGHNLTLTARNMENETTAESLEIINSGNLTLEIGLNVNYLIDVLMHLEGETVQLHLENGEQACLLMSKDEPDVRHVIMPMRI